MKYLTFTIIFLASCGGKTVQYPMLSPKIGDEPSNRTVEELVRFEVKEKGSTYILYREKGTEGLVVIDATKDSLTTELLKQTLERNDN